MRKWPRGQSMYDVYTYAIKTKPKRNRIPQKGFVYIAMSDNCYKIGCSVKPEKRMRELSTGTAHSIALIHVIETDDMFKLEAQLKREYKEYLIRGEWFALNENQISSLKKIRSLNYANE